MATMKEVAASLVKAGAKEFTNVVVSTASVNELDTCAFLQLYLGDTEVPGYRNRDGELKYVEDAHTISVGFFDLLRVVQNVPELAPLWDSISKSAKKLAMFLAGARITLYTKHEEGNEVTNPFTGDARELLQPTVLYYVTSIELSKEAKKRANDAAMYLLFHDED